MASQPRVPKRPDRPDWQNTEGGEQPYAQITQISNENGVYWGFGVQMYTNPSRNDPRGAGSAGSTGGR